MAIHCGLPARDSNTQFFGSTDHTEFSTMYSIQESRPETFGQQESFWAINFGTLYLIPTCFYVAAVLIVTILCHFSS
jgi:hypothetical protein